MTRFTKIFFLSCLLCASAHAAPQRIVSANLCADQLLLQLADKSQIRALTNYAHDASLSYFVREAEGIPSVRGSIESVLPLQPDLVLLGPGRLNDAMAKTFETLHIHVLRVDMPATLKEVEEQIHNVAIAIGQEKRGRTLIAHMQSQMIQTKLEAKKLDYTPRVAFLYNGGYAEGRGGLLQDMMNQIGLENWVQSKTDRGVSIESLITDTPDVIVESKTSHEDAPVLGELRSRHPAMHEISERTFLTLPPAMTICGNNMIADVGKDMVQHLIESEPAPQQTGMAQ